MYTLEQIKAAFWEQFHKSGELWFPYTGKYVSFTEEECELSTQQAFTEFVEKLNDTDDACSREGSEYCDELEEEYRREHSNLYTY